MKKILVTLLFVSSLFASCATSKVSMSDSEYSITDQDVAMMEMEFSERGLPSLPLIDAGLYKSAVSSVADSLNGVEDKKQVEMNEFYRNEIASRLKKEIATVPNNFSSLDEPVNAKPSEELKSCFKEALKETNAGYLLVPTARVVTTGVSAFGIKGASVLESKLFIFDRNGELVSDGYYRTKPVNGKPKDVAAYEDVINQYETLAPELFNLMIH